MTFRSEEYNQWVIERLDALLKKEKDYYYVDLHIHTNNSADGLQSVEAVINRAKAIGFDIISITDHDSIHAYEQLFSTHSKMSLETPIIIPGVEFSVSFPEYGSMCHVLKYFYDTSDPGFQSNITQNDMAYWNRAKLQFERIDKNKCLNYFFNKYNVHYSLEAYKYFLIQHTIQIPEYTTLIDYLHSLLIEKGVNVWDIYYKTVEFNELDSCEERREKKRKVLDRFLTKYNCKDIAANGRKLLPILAPVDIDDANYTGYESSGNFTINEYGQVTIDQLKNCGMNVLAHPGKDKIDLLDGLTDVLTGLELNYRSTDVTNNLVADKIDYLSLITTIGSDSHSVTDDLYDDLSFYKFSHARLSKFLSHARDITNNNVSN
ncbi:MAG: PHP domain-containing protein [Chitinispirillaceae bacterium]|nr:PHP domain-containing protein [Chitinispirillaceae bacterium]